MRPKAIRAADCRRTSWRNGGGETVELAVHPPGANLDSFDWRISMAGVTADGPFSPFPEVDRTLLVLSGGPIELAVAGGRPVLLDRRSQPFSFPGEAAIAASLAGAPVTDLNVMTRRGRCVHAVRRLGLVGPEVVGCGEGICVVFCVGEIDADGLPIGPRDAIILKERLRLAPIGGPATVAVICIWAASSAPVLDIGACA